MPCKRKSGARLARCHPQPKRQIACFASVSGTGPDEKPPESDSESVAAVGISDPSQALFSGTPPAFISAPTIMIPKWMADTYAWWRDTIAFIRRLGLPEYTLKSKLPYYKYAYQLQPQFGRSVAATT